MHPLAVPLLTFFDCLPRSTSFLYLSFGGVFGGLIGPLLAGILMDTVGPWIPILLVFGITPLVFGMLLFIPETLPVKLKTASDEAQPRPLSEVVSLKT
jgi:PCFT/HCP family folate transporter-like MFS transporter 1/3